MLIWLKFAAISDQFSTGKKLKIVGFNEKTAHYAGPTNVIGDILCTEKLTFPLISSSVGDAMVKQNNQSENKLANL